jgi:hypothetical protein
LDGDRSNIVRADEKLTAFRDSKRRFEDAPVRPSETLSIVAIGEFCESLVAHSRGGCRRLILATNGSSFMFFAWMIPDGSSSLR